MEKKVIGLMKVKLGGRVMREFSATVNISIDGKQLLLTVNSFINGK